MFTVCELCLQLCVCKQYILRSYYYYYHFMAIIQDNLQ